MWKRGFLIWIPIVFHICLVGVNGIRIDATDQIVDHASFSFCSLGIDGFLPNDVTIPCETMDHVELELWKKFYSGNVISKLELTERIESENTYRWKSVGIDQSNLETSLRIVDEVYQHPFLLASMTETNNTTTILIYTSYPVSSVKFSVTEEWQRSKRGFFVGYWDRSMYASCHDISCVTGVIQSSQFWRIAVSGPNLTVNIEFIPFKNGRKLKELERSRRMNDPRLRPIVFAFIFEIVLLTGIVYVLLY